MPSVREFAGVLFLRSGWNQVRDRWSDAAARRLRACLVLIAALGGIYVYADFLKSIYPVEEWLFWRLATIWSYGLVLNLAFLSSGFLVVSVLLKRSLPALEMLVVSAATGVVTFALAMYVGGALRIYTPVFAIGLAVALIASGARPLLRFVRQEVEKWRNAPRQRDPLASVVLYLALAWGAYNVALVYLQAMSPDSLNFDSVWCHLTVAQDYARNGRIIPFVADYARTVPQLASIIHTWGWLMPGQSTPMRWMLALHNEFLLVLWTLVGVSATVRWFLNESQVRGSWVVFFLFPAIFVYDSNIGGAADHVLASLALPLFLVTVRAVQRFEPRACVLAGILAGGALLTKYHAVYYLSGIALVIGGGWVLAVISQVRRRRNADHAESQDAISISVWRRLILGPILILSVAMLTVSPHFIKNLVFYGNPVYPFMQNTFQSRPTVPDAEFLFEYLFKDWAWRPHGTFFENLRESQEIFFTFSFKPHYSLANNWPIFGSLFTLCLALLPFTRGQKRIWLGVLAAWGALMAWAMTFRVDRNLQTFAPLLIAVTGAIILRVWELGWIARAGLIPLVAFQAIWGGDASFYSGWDRMAASASLIRGGYDGKRKERFAYRNEYREIGRALPPDARVLLHTTRGNLGIDREILLDWAGQQGLFDYRAVRGQRELFEYFKARGVTHLLHQGNGSVSAPTKQESVLFIEFVRRYGKNPRSYGGYELVEMPVDPPPVDRPSYDVFAIGLWGYEDGLYPLDSMDTIELLPAHLLKFPRPQKAVGTGLSQRLEALKEADAFIVSNRVDLDPELLTALSSEFFAALSLGTSYTIYLPNQPRQQ